MIGVWLVVRTYRNEPPPTASHGANGSGGDTSRAPLHDLIRYASRKIDRQLSKVSSRQKRVLECSWSDGKEGEN